MATLLPVMLRRLLVLIVVVLAAHGACASAAVPAWTSYRHDAGRSGIDPDSANPVTPARAWQTPALDGEVYGQPLVYGANVYVATENDTVYKLDAASGAVVWSRHLATPEPASAAPCGDISPTIGITGTPVIDPATNRIYAVGAVSSSGIHHQLFALDLSSGQPISGFPTNADPPFPSGGTPVNQLQRPGLALDGNRVLIGYGGNAGDCATYWGWLVSVAVDGSGARNAFQADAHHTEGAIWGSGNAPPIDAAGNVFVATGNGSGNSSSDPDYGDTVVKLNASASPLDFWAPVNWQSLDSIDADLGSSLPTLMPGGYVFQSGKDGNGYLVNGASLGHVSAPARQVNGLCSSESFGGSVYDPTNSTLYVTCTNGVKALTVGSGAPPSLSAKAGFAATNAATGPPIIAGGLVWSANRSSGTLYGLDPTTGATRSHFSIPEAGPEVNHFAIPSAGGGRLFMASGNQVTAFTIAQAPPPTATSTTLTSSPNPGSVGSSVTLTATVSPAPDAGTIRFTNGGAAIAGCSAVAISTASGGSAVCHTTFKLPGTRKLAAAYSGDAFYAASSSAALSQSVVRPPAITRVTLTPRRFNRSTTLRLTLNKAGTISFAVTKLRRGHEVKGRCRAGAHRGKKCTTRVTLARRRLKSPAGRHRFKLAFHRLAPGRYTALIYATDRAGRRSRTTRITFTILSSAP